jgi:hypothetical protein
LIPLGVDIPLSDGGKYVFGAYAVFLVIVLIYLAITAMKFARIERELTELNEAAERRGG